MADRNFIGKKFINEVIENEAFDEVFGNYTRFNNMKLINCSFSKAELHSTKWINTTFEQNTNFKYCNLEGTVFENVTFEGKVDFSGSKLSGATFRDCRFVKSDVRQDESQEKNGINFSSCILRDSVFENCTFQNSDLRGAEFHKSSIQSTDFSSSITWRTDFFSSEIRKSSFDSSTLEESSFLYAEISRTSFRNATLKKLTLQSAVIERSDFTGADTRTERFHRNARETAHGHYHERFNTYKCQISGSTFDGAHLELFNLLTLDGCSLKRTHLPWTSTWQTRDLSLQITNSTLESTVFPENPAFFLRGANLSGSHVSDCDFSKFDFYGASSVGVRFDNCNFSNSGFLDSSFLNTVFSSCSFQSAQFARGEESSRRIEIIEGPKTWKRKSDQDIDFGPRYPDKSRSDYSANFEGSEFLNCRFSNSNLQDVIPMNFKIDDTDE